MRSGGADDAVEVEVGGRTVRVTKPDRVLWPRAGLTKAWLLAWYAEVAPVLLAHIGGHPVTLHRFPEGVEAEHWYQTRAPARPAWVPTVTFRPERTGKVFDVVVVDDAATLVWAAQIGTVEVHPFLGRASDLDHPRWLVFDLDPGPGADVVDAARVAVRLRVLLADLGLDCWAKTSGQKGVHVVVPLVPSPGYGTTKAFARAVAAVLARETPELVTDVMRRSARQGKVFVDWGQNDPGKSTVAPYSLRGLVVPTVSTPVSWDELESAVEAGDRLALVFTPDRVARRLEALGDPASPERHPAQALPATAEP